MLSSETAAQPTFTAPEVTEDTEFTFTLVVNDGTDDSDPAEVTVTVQHVNNVPVADAGPDQTVAEGETITLDGSNSSDADGETLTYQWTTPEGITLSSETMAQPTFTAPEVTEDSEFTFTLVVNDGTDDSDPAEVTVTVQQVNNAPVADAGPDQTVVEGETVALDGSNSSDADSDPLTYQWTAPEGITLSSETVAQPTFTAPEVTEDSEFTFTLVVNDGTDNSDSEQIIVTVQNDPDVGTNFSDLSGFEIYPNPTSGQATIQIQNYNSQETTVVVYNLLGKIVFEKKFYESGEHLIDLSHQVSGVYLVHCISNEVKQVKKLIINKMK
jgi:hypothetical protein